MSGLHTGRDHPRSGQFNRPLQIPRPALPPPHIAKTTTRKPLKSLTAPPRRLLLTYVDWGLGKSTPLDTHVVISGFPRSGTTLCQLMVQSSVGNLKCFEREVRGLDSARDALRNQRYMLTKRPNDIFMVQEIRDHYAHRRAAVKFVLLVRDPRGVLTSCHSDQPGSYYVSVQRWRAFYEHWKWALQGDDTVPVRYEDLVANPAVIEKRLTDFIGWEAKHPFADFYCRASSNFDTTALNGLRPPEPANIERWREDQHGERIRQLLQVEMPELPQRLIDMGYEANADWIKDYLEP